MKTHQDELERLPVATDDHVRIEDSEINEAEILTSPAAHVPSYSIEITQEQADTTPEEEEEIPVSFTTLKYKKIYTIVF